MQVAVVAVRMVKRAADGEVNVVAVRDGVVTAERAVRLAALHRGAGARAAPVHLEPVLVGVVLVRRVEVPVVEIVGVAAVPDLAMAAAGAVPVVVVAVLTAGHRRARRIVSLERAGVNP